MIASILLNILGPILVLVSLGALARWRFKIDVGSLSKLNIYIFLPGFFFDNVVNSALSLGQSLGVVLATATQVALLGGLVWCIGRAAGASRKTVAAMAMCVMFYNAGNFGLPLSELAFPGEEVSGWSGGEEVSGWPGGEEVSGWSGGGVDRSSQVASERQTATAPLIHPTTQPPLPTAPPIHLTTPPPPRNGPAAQAFVVFCQNVLTFSVGLFIAGSASGGTLGNSLKTFLRMPTLYTLTIALLARWYRMEGGEIPQLVTITTQYLSKGLVPVALITLGTQLAMKPRWPRWKPVSFVMVIRLLWAPAQMALLLYGLHLMFRGKSEVLDLWTWPAENLILTAGVPTAINTLLVTLEVGGDAELTADCVFWTTVFSAITITGWLVLIRSGVIAGL